MKELYEMYASLGVSREVYEFGQSVLDSLKARFEGIDAVAEYNQAKVIRAMQEHRVDATCFAATTGYGYDDLGRDKLERVYASAFGTEAALVRPQITCGTHALAVALSANLLPGDELLSPNGAPYDTLEEVIGIRESKCSLKEYGVSYRQVDLLPDGTFDFEGIRKAINEKTKVLILNTPNNPTGVVYPESVIKEIADCLREESAKYGHEIIIISDEPYRELVYGDIEVPYITKYYDNTVVSYSYSKSLSLPGERIGYLVIPDELADSETVKAACGVATRIMGFVNAPAIMQKVVKENIDAEVDVEVYNKNRLALYNALTEYGFECVKPDGAFYLFMKTPTEDEREFTDKAREYNILVVPCSDFGGKGYVRIAYCVSYDTIERSLPAFKKLAEFYGLTK